MFVKLYGRLILHFYMAWFSKLNKIFSPLKYYFYNYFKLPHAYQGMACVFIAYDIHLWIKALFHIVKNNFQLRNKPVEPPKKPEKAPFFLPSIPSLSGEILFQHNADTINEEKNNELMHNNKKIDLSSQFILLLQSCTDTRNCKYILDSVWIYLCMHFLLECNIWKYGKRVSSMTSIKIPKSCLPHIFVKFFQLSSVA